MRRSMTRADRMARGEHDKPACLMEADITDAARGRIDGIDDVVEISEQGHPNGTTAPAAGFSHVMDRTAYVAASKYSSLGVAQLKKSRRGGGR